MPRRCHAAFTAAALLLAACGTPEPDAVVPLQPWFRELRTVAATAGSDTLTLLLDTGGGATLITPDIAARLGCRPYGRDIGHRMTGETVEMARCPSLTLGLGGWTAQLRPVAVYDVNALLPSGLPRLDGVLALDAFRGRVISLDWPGGTLAVRSATSAGPAVAATGVAFRAATGETGRFLEAFLPVEGTRGRLWLLLDSGNLRGTLVGHAVLRDSLLPLAAPDTALVAVGDRSPAREFFTAADLQIDGALGTSWLMRGPITLDLRRLPP